MKHSLVEVLVILQKTEVVNRLVIPPQSALGINLLVYAFCSINNWRENFCQYGEFRFNARTRGKYLQTSIACGLYTSPTFQDSTV